MDIENELEFYHKNPFAIRLTEQDKDFINENYDDLFDGDHKIQPRKAFVMLVEKALYNVKKIKASKPEDMAHIAELEQQLKDLSVKHREISTQFNDCVSLKESLEKRLNEANETIRQLQENPQTVEVPKEIERDLQPTERLLQLTPLEASCLTLIEKAHNCDAKEILINRFFMVFMKRGNGDFNIQRIAPGQMKKIEDHFKAQQQ